MSAHQGWIADPPPPPPRDYIAGEEHKWSIMMSAGQFSKYNEAQTKDEDSGSST